MEYSRMHMRRGGGGLIVIMRGNDRDDRCGYRRVYNGKATGRFL